MTKFNVATWNLETLYPPGSAFGPPSDARAPSQAGQPGSGHPEAGSVGSGRPGGRRQRGPLGSVGEAAEPLSPHPFVRHPDSRGTG